MLDRLYASIADAVDVGTVKYEEAAARYSAVGAWLDADTSPLRRYSPTIRTQGSFALGTAIRPLKEQGEIDIDLLCELKRPPPGLTQGLLRKLVGDRLRSSQIYANMLKPMDGRRRCWTLQYADASRFHMDIVPAIPDEEGRASKQAFAESRVLITDKEVIHDSEWPKSNPIGYRDWFRLQMKERFEERRLAVAIQKQAQVEDVPEYEVQTTLQRAIQLLKRHRDVQYGDDEDRPISIILTTLAALAYDNDRSLSRTVQNLAERMAHHVEFISGVHLVRNPVNEQENFADKWIETPRKRNLFVDWLESFAAFDADLRCADADRQVELLEQAFGVRVNPGGAALAEKHVIALSRGDASLPMAPHARPPKWPEVGACDCDTVSIRCTRHRRGYRSEHHKSGEALDKNTKLTFRASTTARHPYKVYWQVVNTGDEAELAGGLRGGFYEDNWSRGRLTREEHTRYAGAHWVECFIVKGGKLAARSGAFLVKIR